MAAVNGPVRDAPAAQEICIGEHRFLLRDVVDADRQDLVSLHVRVFGPGAGDAWYQWKYVEGHGLGTGLWHQGELISHCGGVPRALWGNGRPHTGIQIGDVMVAPEWRGILTRRGPFFHASEAFYQGHVGKNAGHEIAFGFPSERHLRLAVMLQLLWDGGPIHALSWDVTPDAQALSSWVWRWSEVDAANAAFDELVGTAWATMRAGAGDLWVGERGAEYVRWRYCNRPERRSRFFALSRPWSRKPVGIAVLDMGGASVQWLDWIGAPSMIGVAVTACLVEAARAGAQAMDAWTSPAVTQSLQSSRHGRPSRQSVTAWLGIPRASSLEPEALAGMRWWLMGGDTDFL